MDTNGLAVAAVSDRRRKTLLSVLSASSMVRSPVRKFVSIRAYSWLASPCGIRSIRVIRGQSFRKFLSIRVRSWLPTLRRLLERRKRIIDRNPGQFIFEEDRFLRRERSRIIERRNRHINVIGVFAVFEKQMRSATRGKGANPVRVRNLARFAFSHDQLLARH